MSLPARKYIVQERLHNGNGVWVDDPDQPTDCTHGMSQAMLWMEADNAELQRATTR
jgi:hypothetical protein